MHSKTKFVRDIRANEGIIYKASRLYANTVKDQKDLFQEIVYQLWKSYGSFKENAKVSTWMYHVALNTAINSLKKEKSGGGYYTNGGSLDRWVKFEIKSDTTFVKFSGTGY
ncbi:MAG: sigma-70 family RNA polymerase sigma factor [Flagellimonas sp.]